MAITAQALYVAVIVLSSSRLLCPRGSSAPALVGMVEAWSVFHRDLPEEARKIAVGGMLSLVLAVKGSKD
jgi:hypothetical protein